MCAYCILWTLSEPFHSNNVDELMSVVRVNQNSKAATGPKTKTTSIKKLKHSVELRGTAESGEYSLCFKITGGEISQ